MNSSAGMNPQNPLGQELKKLFAKRHKTEADDKRVAELDFLVKLYLMEVDGQLVPCVPGDNVEGMLVGTGGAVANYKGLSKKKGMAGIISVGPFPLEYEGPKDPHELQQTEVFNFWCMVNQSGRRIYKVRPIFREWAANVEVLHNPEVVDRDILIYLMEYAGEMVGLMDWRPKYGAFTVEVLE